MLGQAVGYVRVSSMDQNPARQLEQLGVTRNFVWRYFAASYGGLPANSRPPTSSLTAGIPSYAPHTATPNDIPRDEATPCRWG